MNGKTGTDAMPTGTTSGTPQVLLAHQGRDSRRSASALIGDIEDAYEVLIDMI